MASYAKASEERLNERYAEYESKYLINNNDPEFPFFSPVSSADFNNLSNFEFGEITNENQYIEEKDFNLFVNFELPSDLFGNGDGNIKFGARGRFKTKLRDNNFFEFDLESTFPSLGGIPVKDYTDLDYLAGSRYAAGFFADEGWLGGLNLASANGDSVDDEFLRDNFEVDENVVAAYFMADQKLSDKLSVLFGVRFEATKLTATGNEILDEDTFVQSVTRETNYANFLLGVHFKYDVTNNTVVRFAWTNTLARPNYVDITPFQDVVTGDDEIFIGNTDLDPQQLL